MSTTKVRECVNAAAAAVGTLGSLFVKKNAAGTYDIAITPLVLIVVLGSSASCSIQDAEPFSQCLKSTLSAFKEVFNANQTF